MTQSDTLRQTRRAQAIVSLLQNPTIELAASAAGISARTMQRLLSDASFQVELRAACDQALDQTARRLSGMSACAIGVLDTILSNDETAPGVKARTSDLVLQNALRFQEAVHLARRVQALEQGKGKVQDAKETTDTD